MTFWIISTAKKKNTYIYKYMTIKLILQNEINLFHRCDLAWTFIGFNNYNLCHLYLHDSNAIKKSTILIHKKKKKKTKLPLQFIQWTK